MRAWQWFGALATTTFILPGVPALAASPRLAENHSARLMSPSPRAFGQHPHHPDRSTNAFVERPHARQPLRLAQAVPAAIAGTPLLQVTGVLEAGDAKLEDGTLYDRHTFAVEANQAVVIRAESDEFDTYLLLQDGTGRTIAENDDISIHDRNSQIGVMLSEPGTYTVFVNAYSTDGSGAYQLTVMSTTADSLAVQQSLAEDYRSQAESLLNQSDLPGAIAAYEAALAIYQAADLQLEASSVLHNIGLAYFDAEQYADSVEYFAASIQISQSLGNAEPAGFSQYYAGNSYLNLQNYDAAIAVLEAALASFASLPDTPANRDTRAIGQSIALSSLASVYYEQGDKENELRHQEQAVDWLRTVPPSENFVVQLDYLGLLLGQFGRYEESLAAYQEAIALSRELNLPARELLTRISIGQLQRQKGYYPEALASLQAALDLSAELSEAEKYVPDSFILGEIASVYSDLGEYELSLEYYQQAYVQAEANDDIQSQLTNLNNRSIIYEILGEYEQSLNASQQALTLSREARSPANELTLQLAEASALQGIGSTYESLGQYDLALDYYQQTIDLFRYLQSTSIGIVARRKEADALNGMGIVYSRMEDYTAAIAIFEQALTTVQALNLPSTEAAIWINLGVAHSGLSNHEQTRQAYERSLAIGRRIGSPAIEATSLNNLGVLNLDLAQPQQAITELSQALVLAAQMGDRVSQAETLMNLGSGFEDIDQPELAILFLKQSVNTFEAIRGDIRGLDLELQASYVDSIASIYRDLADLLLRQDRVLEAQRVLDLLKVQELDEFLSNVRGNARTENGLEYWRPEAEILDQYQDLQADAITLGQELAELNARKTGGTLTDEEEVRRQQLTALQTELTQQFNRFIDSDAVQTALDQLSRRELRQAPALEELSGLRNNLAALDAVLFYPLILEDRLELIVTAPNQEPIRRTVEGVGRADLNRAVRAFRQALGTPSADATAPAQTLYQWLIEPIEADLAAAGAETIIYSPDGALRYVPLAALHDGDRWLVERFQVNNITAESLTELNAIPQTTPRVLAGAFADRSVRHAVRGQDYGGLWFAGQEVEQLTKTTENITSLFDTQFNLDAVMNELGNVNVLHFATHAAFVPGDPEASFILFGSGETLTLAGIRNLSLADVDLVVLSACETGLGGYDNNGEQILGLGYQFQTRGAKAIVASLWTVDDGGTQALMTAFYRALGDGLGKAEALRQAQLAMLTGEFVSSGGDRRGIGVVTTESGEELYAGNQLSHPYYWAPFILIGNGL